MGFALAEIAVRWFLLVGSVYVALKLIEHVIFDL
jgi:hypothetical protein